MPRPGSSNRYSPLSEPDEVRIEMAELQTQEDRLPRLQDFTHEAEGVAAGTSVPPPVRIWNKDCPHVYNDMLNEPPKDGSWETLKKGIDKYDDDLGKAWNGELDTILIFVCVPPVLPCA